MKKPLAAVGIALLIMFAIYLNSLSRAREDDHVTLTKPNGDNVQMFEHAGLGDEGETTLFRSGTSCAKLSGPSAVDFGDGVVLHFYRLTCNGTTGYVNVRWVSLY